MGKGKLRNLLVACVTMMLCTVAIVGGTYSLWSDSVSVNNHLKAGTLEVKLERTCLVKTYLDSDSGRLVTSDADRRVVDFSQSTSENVFGISNGEKVVPKSSYEATLRISNLGDVAFVYDIAVILDESSDAVLTRQLKVSVTYEDGGSETSVSKLLSECDDAIVSSQTMDKEGDQSKEFVVKIEFVDDDENNNTAINKEVKFDLSVTARQLV